MALPQPRTVVPLADSSSLRPVASRVHLTAVTRARPPHPAPAPTSPVVTVATEVQRLHPAQVRTRLQATAAKSLLLDLSEPRLMVLPVVTAVRAVPHRVLVVHRNKARPLHLGARAAAAAAALIHQLPLHVAAVIVVADLVAAAVVRAAVLRFEVTHDVGLQRW